MSNNGSYYEIVLGVIIVVLAVAFLQDSSVVKVLTALMLFLVYLTKEIILFFTAKENKKAKDEKEAIRNAQFKKELDQLRADMTKLQLKHIAK